MDDPGDRRRADERRRCARAKMAAMTGTNAAVYMRERPGMSAFVLEDGVVYHSYSTYSRGARRALGRCTTGSTALRRVATSKAYLVESATTLRHTLSDTVTVSDASPESGDGAVRVFRLGSYEPFVGLAALVFVASAAATIISCALNVSDCGDDDAGRMDAVDGVDAHGRRSRGSAPPRPSRACGLLMMVAMMMPSVAPLLWRYRCAVEGEPASRVSHDAHSGDRGGILRLCGSLLGAPIFPFGAALAAAADASPCTSACVPLAAGVVVAIAGAAAVHRMEGLSPRLLP